MKIKRILANATPYVAGAIVVIAGGKQQTHAQDQSLAVTNNIVNTSQSITDKTTTLLEFIAEHPFTLNDFDLTGYTFSGDDLHKLTNSAQNEKLIRAAHNKKNSTSTKSLCYRGVKNILRNAKIDIGDMENEGQAYMAANSLAKHPCFIEIECDIADIPNLPDGTVIVWGRSRAKPDGHIEVKDGQFGRCDKTYKLRTKMGEYTKPRFFVVNDMVLQTVTAEKLIGSNRLKNETWEYLAEQTSVSAQEIATILGVGQYPGTESENNYKIIDFEIAAATQIIQNNIPQLRAPQIIMADPLQDKQRARYQQALDKAIFLRSKKRNNRNRIRS